MRVFLVAVAAVMALSTPALAMRGNKPCSGKKGGVSHCSGAKFVCKDGSISASKRTCSR